jgi:hypothetical protein
MATTVECNNTECPEYGIEKGTLGGGEIDMSTPTFCGRCGTVLVEGDGVEIGPVTTDAVEL